MVAKIYLGITYKTHQLGNVMHVLVIGGTGFLGRYVVEQLLQEHYPVTVLTRDPQKINVFSKKIPYIVGDLLHYKDIDFSAYTHIINCSGELKREELMQTLHVECIAGILNQIKSYNLNIHWVHVSSVGVYGKVLKGVVHEDSPFAPIGQYEITKAEGEVLVKQFCLANNLHYTIIRPSNVFGIGMPNQSLAQLVSMIRKKLFFYIGRDTSSVVMNYVPVEDVASLVALCLSHPQALNQEFIISDQLCITDFVQVICNELSVEPHFYKIPKSLMRSLAALAVFIPRTPLTQARINALTMRTSYSTEKALKDLNYIPNIGLTLGLKNYVFDLISH
jgi:nucleoside-diphosphate-sugar epimerase